MRFRDRLAAVVSILIVLSLVTEGLAAAFAPGMAPPVPATGSAASVYSPPAGLPADTLDSVDTLVARIYGPDTAAADAAATELLRLAAIPIVSMDGPVVAMPSRLVARDAEFYNEQIPNLVRSVRRGDGYSAEQLLAILVKIDAVPAELPASALLGGLGIWGKLDGDPVEALIAGSAVRAMSARDGSVLYSGADPSQVMFNPLQTHLIIGYFMTRTGVAKKQAGGTPNMLSLFGVRTAYAQDKKGPCDDLSDALETPENEKNTIPGEVKKKLNDTVIDAVKESWVEVLKKATDTGKLGIRTIRRKVTTAWAKVGSKVLSYGTQALNVILLLLGVQVDITADQYKTHFKHKPGDTSKHVVLTAHARFDSDIAKQKIKCYKLAGVDVLPSGPLEDWTITWSVYGDDARPVAGDGIKITKGNKTNGAGKATFEIEPKVERQPGSGPSVLQSGVVVTATIDKRELPFELSDLWSGPGLPAVIGTKVAKEIIKDIGLPTARQPIGLEYHGTDIYRVKGNTHAFMLLAEMDTELDIVSCDGPNGPWFGKGGIRNAQITEWYRKGLNAAGDVVKVAEYVIKRDLPDLPKVKKQTYTKIQDVDFTAPGNPVVKDFPIADSLHGFMILNTPESGDQTYGVVGTVELFVGESSLHALGEMIGMFSARYPIERVQADDRCPETDKRGYYFDNAQSRKSKP